MSLLLASICYFLNTRLMLINILSTFVFLFSTFVFYLCVLRFCIVLCIVPHFVHSCLFPINVEYIYGFVLWGGLQAKSITSQRYRAVTRWRICVTMATLWQQQDGGYALLWKRYDNNDVPTFRWRILHLQQYSHRLNFLFIYYRLVMHGNSNIKYTWLCCYFCEYHKIPWKTESG